MELSDAIIETKKIFGENVIFEPRFISIINSIINNSLFIKIFKNILWNGKEFVILPR